MTEASECHCQSRAFTSISRSVPSRGSRLYSTCEIPWNPSSRSSARAPSTAVWSHTASPTRQVPTPAGACSSLRPQNTPSARPSAAR